MEWRHYCDPYHGLLVVPYSSSAYHGSKVKIRSEPLTVHINYKEPFRGSGQAVRGSSHPLVFREGQDLLGFSGLVFGDCAGDMLHSSAEAISLGDEFRKIFWSKEFC